MNARAEVLAPENQQAIEPVKPAIANVLTPVPATAQSIQVTRLAAFTPTNLTEAIALAKLISKSALVPKEYQNKPENVLIGMQYAAELGISPILGLQNISIINGRASVWGDLFLALIQNSPAYEWHKEYFEGAGDDYGAVCVMKRRGQEPHTVKFTVKMAKQAHLWQKRGYENKETPWITNPDRMLQMRARGFSGRDKFSDALKGLIIAEEAMDTPVDDSEAKKKRDSAALTLEDTAARPTVPSPAGVDALRASGEPNRGHGNEGMDRTVTQQTRRQDDVMCAECRQINSHSLECSVGKKLYEERKKNGASDAKSEQDRKTSKPTHTISVLVESVDKKTRTRTTKAGSKGSPFLAVNVVDGKNNKWTLYVWKTDLHEYLLPSVNKMLVAEVSESAPDDKQRVYVTLEHIVSIGEQKFVDDKLVTAESQLELSAEEVGFTAAQEREPGDDDDKDF